MFLISFTLCDVVDGVPINTKSSAVEVGSDPARLELTVETIVRLARLATTKPEFRQAANALLMLMFDYREQLAAIAERDGRPIPDFESAAGGVVVAMLDRCRRSNDSPQTAARWLVSEMKRPKLGGLARVA